MEPPSTLMLNPSYITVTSEKGSDVELTFIFKQEIWSGPLSSVADHLDHHLVGIAHHQMALALRSPTNSDVTGSCALLDVGIDLTQWAVLAKGQDGEVVECHVDLLARVDLDDPGAISCAVTLILCHHTGDVARALRHLGRLVRLTRSAPARRN